MNKVSEMLKKIPKSELHVHLRGAMPAEIFTEFLYSHPMEEIRPLISSENFQFLEKYSNIKPFLFDEKWKEEDVKNLFIFKDFEEFLATYFFTSYFVRNISDFRKLVYGVLKNLKEENIVYAEITVSIMEYMKNGISLYEIKECLEETENFPGLEVQWIVDLVRNNGTEVVMDLLKQVLAIQCKKIVGITLGGAEHLFPPAPFQKVYELAHNHG